ncbi:MAG: hypothetical protein ACRDJH_03005, partial [Thermomicrobiales bacterium]
MWYLPSRIVEDLVAADPPPNYVRFAGKDRFTIPKGSTAIICPGHLPHSRPALYALDAESLSQRATA